MLCLTFSRYWPRINNQIASPGCRLCKCASSVACLAFRSGSPADHHPGFTAEGRVTIRRMPDIEVNGVRLHYIEQGSGPEVVVFSHSYLVDWSHFKPQIDALSDRYRCIAFDHRGHGGSERPSNGYDMESSTRTRSLS